MRPHSAESKTEWQLGIVRRVYPESWEVDVELLYSVNGVIRRAAILGPFLPEVHADGRPSHAVVGWLDAFQQSPVAVTLHNTLCPIPDRKDYVYWSEHHGFRITIREPGHQGELRAADQVGELEIRSLKGGRPLQVRIIEAGGVIRIDTPTTRIVLDDDANKVEVHADGDVAVDAGANLEATAGANASVQAGANVTVSAGGNVTATAAGAVAVNATAVTVTAGAINLVGNVTVTGRLDVA